MFQIPFIYIVFGYIADIAQVITELEVLTDGQIERVYIDSWEGTLTMIIGLVPKVLAILIVSTYRVSELMMVYIAVCANMEYDRGYALIVLYPCIFKLPTDVSILNWIGLVYLDVNAEI